MEPRRTLDQKIINYFKAELSEYPGVNDLVIEKLFEDETLLNTIISPAYSSIRRQQCEKLINEIRICKEIQAGDKKNLKFLSPGLQNIFGANSDADDLEMDDGWQHWGACVYNQSKPLITKAAVDFDPCLFNRIPIKPYDIDEDEVESETNSELVYMNTLASPSYTTSLRSESDSDSDSPSNIPEQFDQQGDPFAGKRHYSPEQSIFNSTSPSLFAQPQQVTILQNPANEITFQPDDPYGKNESFPGEGPELKKLRTL